jgi:hypothetical protein
MKLNQELVKKAVAALGGEENRQGNQDIGDLLSSFKGLIQPGTPTDTAAPPAAEARAPEVQTPEVKTPDVPTPGESRAEKPRQRAEADKPKTKQAPRATAATPPKPATFSPEELVGFQRMGLDPRRLRFLQTLSGLMKGMNLEQELMDRALSGQRRRFSPTDVPLGEYA